MNSNNSLAISNSINEAFIKIRLAINSQLDLSTILKQVVDYNCQLVGCEHASIIIWNSHTSQFEAGASTTKVGKSVKDRIRQKGGASEWILTHKKPLIVTDVKEDPFTANAMISVNEIKAYIGISILHEGEVLGILYSLYQKDLDIVSEDIIKMETLANMAAVAIQNARKVQDLKELNDFKDLMMRMVDHDLRHPLNLAGGYLELLAESLPNTKVELHDWLSIIQRSHRRMDDLITGTLNYSRLSSENNKALFSLYPYPVERW